mgnify:FL=1
MRGLLWVALGLAVLWGGWWFVGSRGVQAGAEAFFAEQSARGLEADHAGITVAGFPSRFDLTVTSPHLADPARGLGWSAPFAQVFAMSWKPWHLIAALPGGQIFDGPGGRVTLEGERMMGSLLLSPGPDLALSEAVAEGQSLRLTGATAVTAVGHVVASVRQEGEATYRLGLKAGDLALSPGFGENDGPGALMSEAYLDARLQLSAPLDRHLGDNRPRPVTLDLTRATLVWGKMRLTASGALAPDADGFAAGEIAVEVRGWRHLPPALAAMGLIGPGFAPALTRGLETMAAEGADPEVLILPLRAKAGRLALGPLPLGAAPRWGD